MEWLESRVQPSFLTGGLDLCGGLGSDLDDGLSNDHQHDGQTLASLASALAAPTIASSADATVTAANNGPGAASSAVHGGGVPASATAAQVADLGYAARSLGLGNVQAGRVADRVRDRPAGNEGVGAKGAKAAIGAGTSFSPVTGRCFWRT